MSKARVMAVLMLIALAAWPGCALAQEPAGGAMLAPVGDPGPVEARMLLVEGRLICQENTCAWQMEQSWILENTESQDHTLNLGLVDPSALDNATLLDEQGNVLTPASPAGATTGLQWPLGLRGGSRGHVTLRYTLLPESSGFVTWSLAGSKVSAWGDFESVRIRLMVPDLTQEDAFVAAEPSHYQFDGTALTWDYEGAASIPDHRLVMLAPPTIAQREALRSQGDYLGLAELLQAIRDDAQRFGHVWPNADSEIGAALQMAAAANPRDSQTLWALVHYYQYQADQHPELDTNYFVLAARALETIVSIDPADQTASASLKQIYAQASRAASQAGDPAGALEYLKLAESGASAPATPAGDQRMIALQWAVSLAEQGRPAEAIAQVHDHLSLATLQDIAHYAPPFAAAETTFLVAPEQYQAQIRWQRYGPSSAEIQGRLVSLLATVDGLPDWSAHLETEQDSLLATMTMRATGPEQIKAASDALLASLYDDTDMLASLLCVPWHSLPEENSRTVTPWSRHLAFAQRFDTTPLTAVHAQHADYAGWRLVEVRSLEPANEIDRLEQRLVTAALEEQVTIWRQLPASCYWVVRVDASDMQTTQPPIWIVDWDQTRPLKADLSDYNWPAIAATAGALLAFVLLLGLTAVWRSKPA